MSDIAIVTARPHETILRVMLRLALVVPLLGVAAHPLLAGDSVGTDFWLAFPANFPSGGTAQLTLLISSSTATSGAVSNASLGISTPFSVTPGAVTSVSVSATAQLLTSDAVENKALHVTALAPVSVYGLSSLTGVSADGYSALPVDAIGTSYIVMSYPGIATTGAQSGFAVVGTQNGTTVTITPSATTAAHVAGTAYTVPMNQGQTYQLVADDSTTADLSGTIITADKPVSVFGASECSNVPVGVPFCDHLVEQLFPVTAWGQNFITVPLATRLAGDVFRLIASQSSTDVSIDGAFFATLSAGQFIEVARTSASWISATKPLLLAQYSKGSSADGVASSDPFMMLIPPTEQFLTAYRIATPASGFTNFVNLTAPASAVGKINIDGVLVPNGNFTAVSSSGYSGATVAISSGSHSLTGPMPFGVVVYGFGTGFSYGYPAGANTSAALRGDANGDGARTVSDLLYLINALFGGGPGPSSVCRGDANGDGAVSIPDVYFLINYFFAAGPAPGAC